MAYLADVVLTHAARNVALVLENQERGTHEPLWNVRCYDIERQSKASYLLQ